jgi:hypothetical protein
MGNVKKRPSKKAKAAQKLLEGSKLLADKTARELQSGKEFESSVVTPRTNTTAIKPRPHKKRG